MPLELVHQPSAAEKTGDNQQPKQPDNFPLANISQDEVRRALGGPTTGETPRLAAEASPRLIGVDNKKLLGVDAAPLQLTQEKPAGLLPKPAGLRELPPPPTPPMMEGPPKAPQLEGPKKIDLKIVDISAVVEQLAHREAEEKLNEYLTSKQNGFFKKMFARMGESGLRYKFYREAKDAIVNNRNLMASIDARMKGQSDTKIAAGSELKSFAYLDEILKTYEDEITEDEEKGEAVHDPAVNQEVAAILMRYAQGKIPDRQAFDDEVERRVIRPHLGDKKFGADAAKGVNANNKSDKEGIMFATNLFKQAEGFKEDINKAIAEAVAEHGKENEEAVKEYVARSMSIDVQLGKKSRDLVNRFPEGQMGALEGVVEWVQGNKIANKFISPLTAGILASAAFNLGTRKLVTLGIIGTSAAFLGPLAAGALAAGAYAAIRKSAESKRDRGLEMRREASGLAVGDKKSERLREHNYDLLDGKQSVDSLKAMKGGELTAAQRTELLHVLGSLEIEKSNGIDLVSVGAEEGVELKTRLFTLNEMRREIKRVQSEMPQDEKFKEAFNSEKSEFVAAKLGEIESKDAGFRKYRWGEMAKAGLIGAAAGMAGGAIMHKLVEWSGPVLHDTSEYWSSVLGHVSPDKAAAVAILHEAPIGNGSVKLPDGVEFISDGKGHGVFMDNFGTHPMTKTFDLEPSGKIPDGVVDDLKANGFNFHSEITHVDGSEFSPELHSEVMDGGAHTFELPKGLAMQHMPDGTFSVVDGTGKVIESGIGLQPDGTLNSASTDLLKAHGWDLKSESFTDNQQLDKAGALAYFKQHGLLEQHGRIDYHANGTPLVHTADQYATPSGSRVDLIDTKDASGKLIKIPGLDIIKGHYVGSDGKELQLALVGKGTNHDLSVLEMAKSIVQGGAKNWDGTTDNKFGNIASHVVNKDVSGVLSTMRAHVYIGGEQPPNGHFIELPFNKTTGNVEWGSFKGLAFDAKGVMKATVEVAIDKEHVLATAVRHGDGSGIIEGIKSVTKLDPHKGIDIVKSVLDRPTPPPIDVAEAPVISTTEWVRSAPKRGAARGPRVTIPPGGIPPPIPMPIPTPREPSPGAKGPTETIRPKIVQNLGDDGPKKVSETGGARAKPENKLAGPPTVAGEIEKPKIPKAKIDAALSTAGLTGWAAETMAATEPVKSPEEAPKKEKPTVVPVVAAAEKPQEKTAATPDVAQAPKKEAPKKAEPKPEPPAKAKVEGIGDLSDPVAPEDLALAEKFKESADVMPVINYDNRTGALFKMRNLKPGQPMVLVITKSILRPQHYTAIEKAQGMAKPELSDDEKVKNLVTDIQKNARRLKLTPNIQIVRGDKLSGEKLTKAIDVARTAQAPEAAASVDSKLAA